MIDSEFTISQQHPSLAGHFPGNPVVPGVVILDEVLRCLKQNIAGVEVAGLPAVKFLSPLLAGKQTQLTITEKSNSVLGFSCHADGKVICSGQIRLLD